MPQTITIRTRTLALVAAIGLAAAAWFMFRPTDALAQMRHDAPVLPSVTFRGNLDVHFALLPETGPAARDFAGPFRRVNEITLTEEYIILRKADAGGRGSLILPREQLVYLNIGE